jgi:hemin uptake protein HemP
MVFESDDREDRLETFKTARTVRIVDNQINSQELFQSERELTIRHGEETYRLRRTGLNKLILTK